jgi:hypothetical protein
VLSEQFGAQSSSSNVEEILLELFWIGLIVDSRFKEGLTRDGDGLLPAADNSVRMDFEFDESLGFSEKFRRKDGDGSGSIADFVVLNLGELAEDLGGGVIDTARSENSCSVIGYLDAEGILEKE